MIILALMLTNFSVYHVAALGVTLLFRAGVYLSQLIYSNLVRRVIHHSLPYIFNLHSLRKTPNPFVSHRNGSLHSTTRLQSPIDYAYILIEAMSGTQVGQSGNRSPGD